MKGPHIGRYESGPKEIQMNYAMLALGIALTVMNAPANAGEIIREGAGWNQVLVNSPGPEVATALKGERYLIQLPDRHMECLVAENGIVVEVRFNKGFDGATTKNIRVGSTEKELLAAYGQPTTTEKKEKAKKLIHEPIGMLFWLTDGKVSQIVVPLIGKK
jgi:hypothetical protein